MIRVPSMAAVMFLLLCACGDGRSDTPAGPLFNDDAVVPELGSSEVLPFDCSGAYSLPAELVGPDGLGHHGWELDDLEITIAWVFANAFKSEWISRNDNATPSLRVRPWLPPEAGYCYVDSLRSATAGDAVLAALTRSFSGFAHPTAAYDAMRQDGYTSPDYDELGEVTPLLRALRGLAELPNSLPGAPLGAAWDEPLREQLREAMSDYPAAMASALARLVLAVGEAHHLKLQALAKADPVAIQSIFQQFLDEDYSTQNNFGASPAGNGVVDTIFEHAASIDLSKLYAAAIAVAGAADALRLALADVAPFESPTIDLLTPHGRILVSTAGEASIYSAEQLADVTVLVDLGGDDQYNGRYAATHQAWMSAAVLIDMSGNDRYSPQLADIEAPTTTAEQAFANAGGFTQGAGLFGVGLLLDAAGDDHYTATVYSQGAGAFGVGLLFDVAGTDRYQVGNVGQGSGYFGIGALVDGAGDDSYGIYTMGQGSGRPWGHGVLLDLAGDDRFVAYYRADEPALPEPGYNNYYGISSGGWPYSAEGEAHYVSASQGVGWGYRGDWFTSGPSAKTNWMGGFGALIDFGQGRDEHYADVMSMGQGFVYGFGLLYDDGGDDRYRAAWWAAGAGAHMGVGVLIEQDGNDDVLVSRAMGGQGYDAGVGWQIDRGGDDRYGGQFQAGKAYTSGMTFFVNEGGNDVYNYDGGLVDPLYGVVHDAFAGANMLGAFLDLGGGNDNYNTSHQGVGNDANWYNLPIGSGVDPKRHKGIGIDR